MQVVAYVAGSIRKLIGRRIKRFVRRWQESFRISIRSMCGIITYPIGVWFLPQVYEVFPFQPARPHVDES